MRASCCTRVIVLGLLLLGACSDPEAEALLRARASLDETLAAGDDSSALTQARRALTEHPGEPTLLLAAARACLGLKRFDEAARHAAAGLDAAPDDPTLIADLEWAKGKAHLALYLQLKSADDWRAANSSLERGTRAAGTHRADAAYSIIRMQGLDGMGSDGRRNKFGRLFLQLEPDGERADTVRTLMGDEGTR